MLEVRPVRVAGAVRLASAQVTADLLAEIVERRQRLGRDRFSVERHSSTRFVITNSVLLTAR